MPMVCRCCRAGAAGAAGFEGRQAQRGGDGRMAFPWSASEARSAPEGARRHQAASSGRRLDSATGIHGEDESRK
ncbi:MAG: hypothetical protein DPW12_14440 [Rhodocyclaceae bacterium]|nr:hypothetical protein [Rhodocyclaceae bacterium]